MSRIKPAPSTNRRRTAPPNPGRKITTRLLLVLAVLAALCGCNHTTSNPSATSSIHESTKPSPTTSNSSPDAAASSPLPQGNVLRAPATLYSECSAKSAQDGNLSFNTQAQVFNPKTGHNVTMPAPTIPGGQRLVHEVCTVGGDIDHIRVFYIITVSTPSNGLTPEARQTSIIAFNPFASDPPQTAPLPNEVDPDKVSQILPSESGFVLPRQNPKQSLATDYIGFDGATLEKSFTIDGSGPIPQSYVNPGGILIYYYGGAVTIFSTRDGHVLTHNNPPNVGALPQSYPNGFTYYVTNQQYGYFNMSDNQLKTPFPTPGDIWSNTFLALLDHALEVRDTTTNAVIFRREGPEFDGLHVKNAYIAGKYLYLANDSDSPVIDITNSQKVSSGWKVRPTDILNRDWILVNNPDTTGAGGSCFKADYTFTCNTANASLRYAPNGNYAGPWY
ncbi:hypothetical protein JF780_07735 [Mycobacterium intracellulare]|uniref:hypothetical protein n=1 Tax=Mycobacterium intracellulare TaxID=1767 RepID=UPI001CDA462A|nr:hypothetical protein [Mycobacterium intracellulare]MCA2272420.1 hypothetical protein [Mycobacterium intracellulare]MCA2324842.1 hypothetical protein [Mycobacterium intracellulare]